jgi:hypothetical protein
MTERDREKERKEGGREGGKEKRERKEFLIWISLDGLLSA